MRSFSLFFVGAAFADETCSATDGSCAQDEATMLQLNGLRKKEAIDTQKSTGVENEGTQCWWSSQCNGQGGECPSGYCGDNGVCCRNNWSPLNAQEAEECGPNGYGINNHHTCQPRLLNSGQQCWYSGQCDQQGGRCQNFCGARGVCCRANWTPLNDKEREECGENGHGNDGMHQCHLPPSPPFYESWPQWEVDNSKCNNNQNLVCVDSHEECQEVAVANGHDWYSFRHNKANNNECNGQHKCFSSEHCDNGLIGDRTNEWIIYRNRPMILAAESTKCPHQHGDRLFRAPEGGSGDISLAECFDLCESTEGCNHYSWGPWEGAFVCMGCTSLTNAQEHDPFTAYDMPGLTRYAMDGCGTDNNGEYPFTPLAPEDGTADVRCCSMDGSSGASQGFEGGEDYFRPGASSPHSTGCMFGKTFLEARAICAAADMRLCAPHEIEVTCGTGCWHNHNRVWVETPTVGVTVDGCSTDNSNHSPDQYPGSDDSQALIPSAQKTIGDTAAVRCCSYNGGSCASTVQGECNDAVSFVEAQILCSEDEKRLCTDDEMNTCCGTGCWYNHFSVWTSSGL